MDSNNMYQQQPYQPQTPYQPVGETPMTVGDWILTLILTCIPCVGIIMLFVWAFGSSTPKSKSNWAKAQLIITAIIMVLTIILYAIMGAAIVNALGNM